MPFKFWLNYLRYLDLGTLDKATAIPGLNRDDAYSVDILIPPLAEQKRIADKLDALLARVDACRRRLDRVPALIKRFRQAVLAAATAGELTADWRDQHKISFNWKTKRLADVAESRLGKMLDQAKNVGDPTPYLRNINVRWFGFNLTDIQVIRVTADERQNLSVRRGDVLICEGGEPGRCAVWRGDDNVFVYQKALHRLRVGTDVLPEWICYCLKHAADSGQLSELFTGTTIKHLTGISLSNFKVELPSIEEQNEIVKRVETLFAFADRLEAHYAAARAQVDKLPPSLLSKAFRGELVPQDPTDEPASALLERIRAERAGQGALFDGATKRRRKSS